MLKPADTPPPFFLFGSGMLRSEGPNFKTDSLLALERCHPRKATRLHPEWSLIGEMVEKYLGEEREAQRVLDQFKRSLFPEVHVSPFEVIPKADPGKWRLILDLSSPHGNSVNDGIAKELCSLIYFG